MSEKKYDVGIYGLWYGHNYGSIITYYALDNVIRKMGYSTVMIKNPLGREGLDLSKLSRSHALVFADKHYEITPLYGINEMDKLNEICDRFVLGSDQMWNYHLSRPYKQTYFFDFVNEDKNKIAYATSFGKEKYIGPDAEKAITKKNLARFNAISVRDDFSKEICEKDFGVSAEVQMDPVFLCEKEKYEGLIKESEFNMEEEFLFAYILDPNPEIGKNLRKIAEKANKKMVIIFNQGSDKEKCKEALQLEGEQFIYPFEPTVNEWLYCFKNAQYIFTDSFHGCCFSVIFHKPFVVKKNVGRGGRRFDFITKQLGISDFMVSDSEGFVELFDKYGENLQINYGVIQKRIDEKRMTSLKWLNDALAVKKVNEAKVTVGSNIKPNVPMKLHPDIERARLLVALVKEYGFKHIVISSGARDVSLARLFEANAFFKTYNVTDERSAAYFAMGIALEVQEPVVIVCTSGTAVSNYLPGVTEAFYQNVPMIIISGDRYPCYIGQMEAQMIEQYGLFQNMCKKSVTLPVHYESFREKWEVYRLICETLLEVNHHGNGPVHINFPIDKLENELPSKAELELPKVNKIERIDFYSDENVWENSVKVLKNAKRIMVIYGQNNPLSETDQYYFNEFVDKYNCVVLTDHISNVSGKWCLKPYRLLKRWKNDQFKTVLMPDLVIYVGGKRILNDPLQGKMRSIRKRINFWHIKEDGKVADMYGKLTTIFECKQNQFFKYFAERAKEEKNNGEYYNLWRTYVESIPPVDFSKVNFTSYYTMGKFALKLPKNSMVHLAVGNTFINIQNYPIDESITVYCNMGTNGIDGSASTFMGQCINKKRKGFLIIGDLSFFYDMNSIWNKKLNGNVRILLNNDGGAGLLSHYKTPAITQAHNAIAEGWVKSLGFKYMSAHNKEEFDQQIEEFINGESDKPVFFEVFPIRSEY